MGLIKNENYINIQGWMVNELGLKGNDLLVYAIIYGFSQNGESKFDGSLQYLADWCNSTKQGIQKNLKNLEDLKLISKEVTLKNGVRFCAYSCIPYNKVVYPIQHSCINNIEDKQEYKTISKDIVENEPETLSDYESKDYDSDRPSRRKSQLVKPKLTLYDKCVSVVTDSLLDDNTKKALLEYLPIRLANKEKPLLGVNQWKGMINKLTLLGGNSEQIVRQSIEQGWASFYSIKNNNTNDNKLGCNRNVQSVVVDENALARDIAERERNGQRITF